MANRPTLYVAIRGDFDAFEADLARVRNISKAQGRAISDALNNAISPAQASTKIYNLARNIGTATDAIQSFKATPAIQNLKELASFAGVSEKSMSSLQAAMIKTARDRSLEKSMLSIQQATGASCLQMARLRLQLGDVSGAARMTGKALYAIRTPLLAAGITTVALAKACFDAAVAQDRLAKSYESITGSSYGAQQQLGLVLETSRKLGLEYTSTAEAAKTFFAASVGTSLEKDMNRIFAGFSKAGTALSLSSEQMQGVFLALGQMVSKGKVQAEELRGQLGEQLPGAFSLAAKAMGMTTAELDKFMADGKLTAEELLPKFADALENQFGVAAENAAGGAAQAVNRMSTEWSLFKANVMDNQGILSAINQITRGLRWYNKTAMEAAERTQAESWLKKKGIQEKGAVELYTDPWDGQQKTRPIYTAMQIEYAKRNLQEEAIFKKSDEAAAIASEKTIGDMRQALSVADKTPQGQIAALNSDYANALKKIDAGLALSKTDGTSVDTIKDIEAQRLLVVEYYEGKIAAVRKKGTKSADSEFKKQQTSLFSWQDELAKTEASITSLQTQLDQPVGDAFATAQAKAMADYRKELDLIDADMDKLARKAGIGSGQFDQLKTAKQREAELKRDLALRKADEDQKERDASRAKDRVDFYKELEQMSGQYGLALAEENTLLDKQVEALGKLGIPPQYLEQWRELKQLQESRDGWDGAKRAALSYYSDASDMAKGFESLTTNAFSGVEDAMVGAFQTGKLSFSDMINSMISDLIRLTVRANITGPLASALSGGIGSLFSGGISSVASSVSSAAGMVGGKSLLSSAGSMVFAGVHHQGGIVGVNDAPVRYLPSSLFDTAPRYHSGGGYFGKDEYPAVLLKKERVLNPSETLAYNAGRYANNNPVSAQTSMPEINIQVVNNTGTSASAGVTQKQNAQGGIDVLVMLKREVASDIARGGIVDQTIRSRYGVSPIVRGR